MEVMVDQFIETWRVNNRVNLKLLDGISQEGLNVSLSTGADQTPARQFAHIHNVRYWRMEKLDKNLVNGQGIITETDEICHELLRIRLLKSAESVAELLHKGYENDGIIEGFRRGVFTLMGYLISHESHHRGNMVLTLKQCGFRLPKSLTIGIWDWNKI